MNKEIIENYFISNGREYAINEIDQISITEPSIYEVIRIISGVPLFLEDHMDRLQFSAASLESNVQRIIPKIIADFEKLIKMNRYPEKNIKLLVFNLKKEIPDYMMCFIKSTYPSPEQYLHGVHSILVHAERSNPNAKVIDNQLKDKISLELRENDAYEALLVNSKGEITEGSRSNLFFIIQEKIYTAPTHDVLIGITRKYIIDACRSLNLEIVEQPIPCSILDNAQGAFITGTSPKLLPIASIEERVLDSANNHIVKNILVAYNRILEKYILEHK